MSTDKPRFSITLDESLLKQVECYQKDHRISTKSRAIHALLKIGLNDYKKEFPSPRAAEKSPPILQDGDETLLTQYHKLDEGDRGFIRGEIAVLLTAEKYQQDAGPAAI